MKKPRNAVNLNTVDELVETIKPILAGHDPRAQGAALAILTAVWLAGHKPVARKALMDMQREATMSFVPI